MATNRTIAAKLAISTESDRKINGILTKIQAIARGIAKIFLEVLTVIIVDVNKGCYETTG